MSKLLIFLCCMVFYEACAEQKKYKWDYIQKYLPEESLIRKRCSQQELMFNIWIFKSQECRSCEYINSMLKHSDQDKQKNYFGQAQGFLRILLKFLVFYAKAEKTKNVVFRLLSDYDEQQKWDECDKVGIAVRLVEQARKKRLSKKSSL